MAGKWNEAEFASIFREHYQQILRVARSTGYPPARGDHAANTRLSGLTSGAISLGLYGLAFAGGWIEQYGSLQHVRTCTNLGIVSSLIMPSDALWRRAAFALRPPLLGSAGIGPFSSTTIPNTAMVIYAVI